MLTSVNLTTNYSFWNNTRIIVSQKRNVIKFRMGTALLALINWPTAGGG